MSTHFKHLSAKGVKNYNVDQFRKLLPVPARQSVFFSSVPCSDWLSAVMRAASRSDCLPPTSLGPVWSSDSQNPRSE